jgi:hypothetical protein
VREREQEEATNKKELAQIQKRNKTKPKRSKINVLIETCIHWSEVIYIYLYIYIYIYNKNKREKKKKKMTETLQKIF